MKTILVKSKNHGDKTFQIDDEDFENVIKIKWYVFKGRSTYYAQSSIIIDGIRQTCLLQRFLLNLKKGDKIIVDHKDNNGMNCQKNNLRICNYSQNGSNRIKKNISTSKYIGVSWEKTKKKRRAQLTHNKKCYKIGYFIDEIEAAKAYNEAAIKLHKEFSNINIISNEK